MSCISPLLRYRLRDGASVSPSRKLDNPNNPPVNEFFVPCGQCGECRISRARSWATRCVHEATQWKQSCFITLTYKTTPPNNSLCPDDTRNFIRRLRDNKESPLYKQKFKYFLAGEYGDNGDRPHYHALIFGTDFGLSNYKNIIDPFSQKTNTDKLPSDLHELRDTDALEAPLLNNLWGLGYTSVGALTFDSAAYTAQYCTKKITGAKAKDHYGLRYPEFMRTSQDAIGKGYALKYAQEIITHNSVISNDSEQPIPNYYLRLYEKEKYNLDKLRADREEFSSSHSLAKSYHRAQQLDSKFKKKQSLTDKLRLKYFKDRYFEE